MLNLILIEDDICTVQLVERIVTRNSHKLFHSYDGQDCAESPVEADYLAYSAEYVSAQW